MLLNYYQEGKGKDTVVILHSGGETALTENEVLRSKISHKYTVISMDLRGHGKSVSIELDDYFNQCANDVIETLNHINIDKFHLVGASIGALVGIFINKKISNQIISLVLSGFMTNRPTNWMELSNEEDERLKEIIQMKEVIDYMDNIHEGDWRKVLTHDIGKDWYPFGTTRSILNINKPTLLCFGENAEQELHDLNGFIKNEHIHIAVLPFAGHLVSEMQPEIYSQIVFQFLEQ